MASHSDFHAGNIILTWTLAPVMKTTGYNPTCVCILTEMQKNMYKMENTCTLQLCSKEAKAHKFLIADLPFY